MIVSKFPHPGLDITMSSHPSGDIGNQSVTISNPRSTLVSITTVDNPPREWIPVPSKIVIMLGQLAAGAFEV